MEVVACEFENTSVENVKKCKNCGYLIRSQQSPERIYKKCKPLNGKQPTTLHARYEKPVPVAKTPEEKPRIKKLSWSEAVKGLVSSLGAFAKNPQVCTREEYIRRTEVCRECPEKNDTLNICSVCKCSLAVKTRGKAFTCPLGKWDV